MTALAIGILAVALCGVTVALTAWGVALPRARATTRVREIDAYGFPAERPDAGVDRRSRLSELLPRLGSIVVQWLGQRYESRIRTLLISAGMYDRSARTVIGVQFMTGVLCASAVGVLGAGDGVVARLLFLGLAGAVGFGVPAFFLLNRGRVRRDRIERKVPDMIDMLVVTLEAGLGFGASMQAAATRIKGPLGEELRLAMKEQEMGLTLRDALFHCGERTGSRSMNSFVRAVTQGEALGVSIGTVMRNIAEEMRVRRRQEAEERAQKAPVKILFPLIFLMFPALMIVILGPAMFEIFKVLGGM